MKYKKSKALALSWGLVSAVFALGILFSALMHKTALAACISSASLVALVILGNMYRKQVGIENASELEIRSNKA